MVVLILKIWQEEALFTFGKLTQHCPWISRAGCTNQSCLETPGRRLVTAIVLPCARQVGCHLPISLQHLEIEWQLKMTRGVLGFFQGFPHSGSDNLLLLEERIWSTREVTAHICFFYQKARVQGMFIAAQISLSRTWETQWLSVDQGETKCSISIQWNIIR
jgi:hypothetical protein